MGYITNLGSMGTPQESALSGLPQALAAGVKLGNEIKTNRNLEQYRQDALKMKKQSMQMELAKQERSEEDRNRKLASDTLNRISLTLMGKSPADRANFLRSEPIKEVTKHLIKKYLPENVDPTSGELIPLPLRYFPRTREEAIQMKVDSQAAIDKLKVGEIPSVTEVNAAIRNIQTIHTFGQLDDDVYKKSMDFYGKLLQASESQIRKANPNLSSPGSGSGSIDTQASSWLAHALEGVH